MKRSLKFITTLTCLLASGCAVGPDFLRPALTDLGFYSADPLPAETSAAEVNAGAAQTFINGHDIQGDWWALYHSPLLNQYIAEAVKANPGLRQAQAALRQAKENTYAYEGVFYPQVDGALNASRQKTSGAEFGIPGLNSLYNLYDATVSVSYTLDIWGGGRRELEAYEAQEEYEKYELEATYLTLTANVVTAAIQDASLRAQIAATEEIAKSEKDQLNIVQSQFELGGASRADVLTQQTTLAQTEATLPPLRKQLAQTRDQLMALTGHFPSDDKDEAFDLTTLKLPEELPVSLPSDLVNQRPDIRASEALLHAASADEGVATANLLPQITLSAEDGTYSTQINHLFSPGTSAWSLAAGVSQPIFHGGSLLHQDRATEAAYDQAAAQYRGIVIAAFQNVADALHALQSDADALKAQVEAERSAADSLSISKLQYQNGAITYVTLLTAQRDYQQTVISLVQAEANRYADTAALFQALGGGWWNRADIPDEDEYDYHERLNKAAEGETNHD